MWQKNSGKSESEILQNLFTAYLTTSVKRRQDAYIQQAARIQQMESMEDDIQYIPEQGTEEDMFRGLPLPMQLENSALLHALKGINERERHVFLARVLNIPASMSLLSGDRKPQIRFYGNRHSGYGNH